MVDGALFALLDNGEIWRSEGGSGPWHLDAEMRPVRRDFAAVALKGRIHILGGMNGKGKALADHDIYDPDNRTWEKGHRLQTPVAGAGAAVVDSVLFVVGGYQGWFLPTVVRDLVDRIIPDWFLTASRTTRSVYALDHNGEKWLPSHPLPTDRSHMGIAVSNNRIHVVGGNRRKPFGTAVPVAFHESYLPTGGFWERRMPLPQPTAYLGMATVDGQLHAIGGMGWNGPSNQHQHYTPLSDSWAPSSPLQQARRDMGVTNCFGEVYALGGIGADGPTASSQSCNVSQTLYIHQKDDGGAGLSQNGDTADTANPSAPGGSDQVGTDSLTPIAAMAASVAAVSAASLAMDPDHASQGSRGAPAIPGGGGASAPALDTPSKVKEGGSALLALLAFGLIAGLFIVVCAGGLTQFPATQQKLQKHIQKVFPSASIPFAPPAPAVEEEPPPDLSRCLPVAGATTVVDVGIVTDKFARGVDVSHYQKDVPWNLLQQAGIVYGVAKATEGVHITDKQFRSHWEGMKNCGILRGAYHFYAPYHDPFKQAQHFLPMLGNDPGELPPVVDVESAFLLKKKDCKKLLPNLVHFVETVARGTNMTPMIYASPGFWNEKFQCSDEPAGAAAMSNLAKYPLWVAQYQGTEPHLFGGWTEHAFWQYTDKGTLGKGGLDLDQFAYGPKVLKAWLKALKKDPTTTPSSVAASMPTDPAAGTTVPTAGTAGPTPTSPTSLPTSAPAVPSLPSLPAGTPAGGN
jgi:GH25 family lysozyme M1 (1,4-beta-N-acetylmuramidase)